MPQLIYFLDIPNAKSLHKRTFNNMEATIWKHLRKVAIKTMKEGTDEEVSLTLNDEKIQAI